MTVASIVQPTPDPKPVGFDPLWFDFAKWDGSPPQLVRQHIEPFSLAGIDGSGARLTGVYGDAFTIETEGAFASLGWAEYAAGRTRELIGLLCLVYWERMDYDKVYKTRYLVENVTPGRIKSHVRLLGPNYDYPLGAILSANWTLRPVYVGDGDPLSPPKL